MFYEPKKNNHGLAHDPFKSCVVPRPIGWISTVGADGVANLAPYSQFSQPRSLQPVPESHLRSSLCDVRSESKDRRSSQG